jgi:hypothetical protein
MAPLSPKFSEGGMGNLRQHPKAALRPAFCHPRQPRAAELVLMESEQYHRHDPLDRKSSAP